MSDKNISDVSRIRRKVYRKLVELVIEDQLVEKINSLPYKIIEEETTKHRCCEYKERAIIEERIKLSLGFVPSRHPHTPLSDLAIKVKNNKINESPVRVIKTACDGCPIDRYSVTDACRNCVAHKCINICPRDAIDFIRGRAYIDQDKCIECGLCKKACPYDAIHENTRPCVQVCNVDAIKADKYGVAHIDHEKCINCGKCINACPFGAIDNLSSIVQVMMELNKKRENVIALLAPSFLGQFGPGITPRRINRALKLAGFYEIYEVAEGADMVIHEEAEEFIERKNTGEDFMTSSCCPAFKSFVEKEFPNLSRNISDALSPMVKIAKKIKRKNPNFKTVFIGPCVAKKNEGNYHKEIDYVLTFEELISLIVGNNFNLRNMEDGQKIKGASALGRSFAISGGVARGIETYLQKEKKINKNYDFCTGRGLDDCREKLEKLKEGKYNIDFMEGMACDKGCISGPGNLIKDIKAKKQVEDFASKAENEIPFYQLQSLS
ncbi:MAG: 4Fe-4S dicluster domain-containing protein [Halanaerobiales bacterium]